MIQMKKINIFFVLLFGLFLISSCNNTSTGSIDNQQKQDFNDESLSTDVNKIINSNNQFALDLYANLKEEEGNIFFSPYSISTALAMTYEGARGQTADEIRSVFYLPSDDNIRRSYFLESYNQLNKENTEYELKTANALWAQEDYQFLDEYKEVIEEYYGGKTTNVDFVDETEEARNIINNWVEDKTNNKIKDLIPPGVLDRFTRLVLTNAIYFKGAWVNQFDEADTKDEDFAINNGDIVKIPMMRLVDKDVEFNYGEDDEIQILELPYEGYELSMIILLPKEDKLEEIENSIRFGKLSELKGILNKQKVNIYVPKFKFETKYFMKETLSDMGMPTAFSNSADFTGMEYDPNADLKIDNVIHQAFVEVNEEGTEAAAATAVIMRMIDSVDSEPRIPTFRADHPFIFIIQENQTDSILFFGRVVDPTI